MICNSTYGQIGLSVEKVLSEICFCVCGLLIFWDYCSFLGTLLLVFHGFFMMVGVFAIGYGLYINYGLCYTACG